MSTFVQILEQIPDVAEAIHPFVGSSEDQAELALYEGKLEGTQQAMQTQQKQMQTMMLGAGGLAIAGLLIYVLLG